MKRDTSLIKEIAAILEEEGRPCDVHLVAKRLRRSWWSVYKSVADMLFEYVTERGRNILPSLPLAPLKTSKRLILVPKSILITSLAYEGVTPQAPTPLLEPEAARPPVTTELEDEHDGNGRGSI